MDTPDEFAPLDDMDGWNTDEQCPWCQKPIDSVYEYTERSEEDFTFDCPHCENEIAGSVWTQFILKRPKPTIRRIEP
jgi:hypothetical protein